MEEAGGDSDILFTLQWSAAGGSRKMDGTCDSTCRVASGIGADGGGRGEIHEVFCDVHEPVVLFARTSAMISRNFSDFVPGQQVRGGAAPLHSGFVPYVIWH